MFGLSVSDLFSAFAGSSDVLDGQSRGVGGRNAVGRDYLWKDRKGNMNVITRT